MKKNEKEFEIKAVICKKCNRIIETRNQMFCSCDSPEIKEIIKLKEAPICNCGDWTENKPMCDTCLMMHEINVVAEEKAKKCSKK